MPARSNREPPPHPRGAEIRRGAGNSIQSGCADCRYTPMSSGPGKGRRPPTHESDQPTIIEYSDRMPAQNQYPRRIVSPTHESPCCFSDMEVLGKPIREASYELQYKRCQTCGFAVRFVLRHIPDPVLAAAVRRILQTTLVRNVP